MIEIELIPDRGKILYIRRIDGKVVGRSRFDHNRIDQQRNTALNLGIPHGVLLDWISQVEDADKPMKFDGFVVPGEERDEYTIRDIDKPRDHETSIKITEGARHVLDSMLAEVPVERVIDWSNIKNLCVLDIDYHDTTAPGRAWLRSVVFSRITPAPYCWHFSRSGGLHLFYLPVAPLAADELAAVAALRWRTIDPLAGVELKRQIRGPGQERVYRMEVQQGLSSTIEWIGSGTMGNETLLEATNSYMETEGLVVGQRYPHSKCPIHPSEDDGKHRNPVVVGEEGIFCHMCAGKGYSIGSKKAGAAPWSVLVDSPVSGDVGLMIQNMAHWGHAKWVFVEKYRLPENLARLAYLASLKVYHQGAPRFPLIENVFHPVTDNFARIDNRWMSPHDAAEGIRIDSILAAMPRTQIVLPDGKVKSDQAWVNLLNQDMSLEKFGYPTIKLIHGVRLATNLPMDSRDTIVAIPQKKVLKKGDRYLPRYLEKKDRMPLDKAYSIMEKFVPDVDWRLIRLIVAGTGVAQETQLGTPPMLFVVGPSATGKTSHFGVAATILGTTSQHLVANSTDERFHMQIAETMKSTPIITVNEIFKDASRVNRRNAAEALQNMLQIDPNTRVHVMYKGSREVGAIAMLGFTEVGVPTSLGRDIQVARRFHFYRLHSRRDAWKDTMAAAGVSSFHDIRLVGVDVADACNTILSDISDEYFSEKMTFDAIAGKLGVSTIEKAANDFDQPIPDMIRFFKLVCAAPELTDRREKNQYPGYKRISKNEIEEENKDLVSLWTAMANDISGRGWTESQQLLAADWGGILKTDQEVKLVIQTNGVDVFVRFHSGGTLKEPKLVNQQIRDPATLEDL